MQNNEKTKTKESQITELIKSWEEARLTEYLGEGIDLEVIPISNFSEFRNIIGQDNNLTLVDIDGVLIPAIKVLPGLCYLFQDPLSIDSIQELIDIARLSPTAVVTNRYEGGLLPNITYRSNRLLRKLSNEIYSSCFDIPIFQKLDRYFPIFGRKSSYSNLFGFLENNILEGEEEITINFVYDLHIALEIAKNIPLAGPLFQYVFTEGRFLRLITDYIRAKRPGVRIKINAFPVSRLPKSKILPQTQLHDF